MTLEIVLKRFSLFDESLGRAIDIGVAPETLQGKLFNGIPVLVDFA